APANQGTARRFDRLAVLENLRAHATANVCVFRSTPWRERPIPVRLLEKHPGSTQLFVPMNARRYLVVVALGGDEPDLATLAAFVARGTDGVTYRPGVWHHPLIALDADTDFACVVFEDGTPGDCATHALGEPVDVDVPDR
ncbi:MAG TPA: ureidoglycolate lyase, partial [Minicystis sp.]|nr:ureidoglycolate lyase [Minicystis sp.]